MKAFGHLRRYFHHDFYATRRLRRLSFFQRGQKHAMKNSFILTAIVLLGAWMAPHAALAQAADQTTSPMATATVNPDETANPNATDNTMGGATATPGAETYTQTSNSGGQNGWWGLFGLIGLLGLFGARSRSSSTTITGPP
jgi:hypothetical protein